MTSSRPPARRPTSSSATSRPTPRAGPGLTAAVRAGVDTVEHGHWIDRETADLMAESGTILVPTLLVNERNFDFPREELGGSDASWRWARAVAGREVGEPRNRPAGQASRSGAGRTPAT